MVMRIVWASLGILAACGLFAQTLPTPLSFDVASIKPSAPDARGSKLMLEPPSGLQTENGTVRMLITFAYNIRDFQLSGGPGWIGTERYDILAKAERSPGSENTPSDPRKMTEAQRTRWQEEMRERVRALLAERFQLTVHQETREAPVYALVVAKGGPKVEETEAPADGPQGIQGGGRGVLRGLAAPMSMLAMVLSNQLGRPVIDKTGLTGKYNYKLQWTPDSGPTGGGPGDQPPPGVEAPPPADPDGPSIFSALQEQLGLRLESQKGPVPSFVIDRVEKPTQN
jgi:uncharacterized protein (TIGR03435 family)